MAIALAAGVLLTIIGITVTPTMLRLMGTPVGYWSYGDETYSFTLKVMSPILEGKVYAVGNEVVIPSASLDG